MEPFNVCELTMNLDDYVSKCVESLCTCANSATNFDEECRCQMLENFASKCLSLQPGVDISSWRFKYECRKCHMNFQFTVELNELLIFDIEGAINDISVVAKIVEFSLKFELFNGEILL